MWQIIQNASLVSADVILTRIVRSRHFTAGETKAQKGENPTPDAFLISGRAGFRVRTAATQSPSAGHL